MRTVTTVKDLRATLKRQREQGKRIGFVPTMGNLHEGHLALVRRALELSDYVVTSIFVNPMQFGANEDLDKYPRTLKADQDKLVNAGNHLLFHPDVEEMYPDGMEVQTRVVVPGISEGHCGASRPGHFTGVATVVTKLFNMVQPDVAVFGEKDFQQLAVIRKMVRDLCMPITIEGLPTVRETDGLAMSSRNGYLSASERQTAPELYKMLTAIADKIRGGDRRFAVLENEGVERLEGKGFRKDYFHIVDSHTLAPATAETRDITLLAAFFLGSTRLIDNLSLTLEK